MVHFRKRYKIPTREFNGEIGEGIVTYELQKEDFVAINMNKLSKIYPFDLLINGTVKVDVKTASQCYGKWVFALANSSTESDLETQKFTKLDNGKVRKRFDKTCDFIILCPLNQTSLFIVPVHEISETLQSITIYPSGRGKWWKWQNRYDLIKRMVGEKSESKRASLS